MEIPNNLTQSQKTHRPNGLTYKLKSLFDQGTLTTWEYSEYIQILRTFAKQKNLYFDESTQQLFEPTEN
jgi:hypothetical protein